MAEYISKHEAYTLMKDLEAAYIYPPVKEAYGTAARRIDQMPSADVQPVKHGRWIGINEYCKKNGYIPSGMGIYYWCSECGKGEPKISDYCPNCGARMIKDGDAE